MCCLSAQELVKIRRFAHWPVATKVPCLIIWSPDKILEFGSPAKKNLTHSHTEHLLRTFTIELIETGRNLFSKMYPAAI